MEVRMGFTTSVIAVVQARRYCVSSQENRPSSLSPPGVIEDSQGGHRHHTLCKIPTSRLQNATDAVFFEAPKRHLVDHSHRPDFGVVEAVRIQWWDRSFCIQSHSTLRPWEGLQARERRAGQMNPASEDRAKERLHLL